MGDNPYISGIFTGVHMWTQTARRRLDDGDRLLTSGEVAVLFRVDPKTVSRWAAGGRIGSVRTPGGHRRYRESEVRRLLDDGATTGKAVG
jgi:excisionase family DNA binding protein